jgi:hypothetical protein
MDDKSQLDAITAEFVRNALTEIHNELPGVVEAAAGLAVEALRQLLLVSWEVLQAAIKVILAAALALVVAALVWPLAAAAWLLLFMSHPMRKR